MDVDYILFYTHSFREGYMELRRKGGPRGEATDSDGVRIDAEISQW